MVENGATERRETIVVGPPQVRAVDGHAELAVEGVCQGDPFRCWFAVEEPFTSYLAYERSDAFLIALLPWAMSKGFDLQFEAPVTREIFFKVTRYLIPTLNACVPSRTAITVRAPLADEPLPTAEGVGTGLSCGVDSLSTVYSFFAGPDAPPSPYRLTHLCFFNVGSPHLNRARVKTDATQGKVYDDRLASVRKSAQVIGLPLVVVDSNLRDFYPTTYHEVVTLCLSSAVHAVAKLFSVYYISSSVPVSSVTICKYVELAEPIILPMLGREGLSFFPSDAIMTRYDKIKQIADWSVARQHLHVCLRTSANDSRCRKCVSTMTALDALGALERFDTVFDVKQYHKNRARIWAKLAWLPIKELRRNMREYMTQLRLSGRKPPLAFHLYSGIFFLQFIGKRTVSLLRQDSKEPT